jgi:hypothetical protein
VTAVRFDALDPRGPEPVVDRIPLAPRLGTLEGARLQIVLTMPLGTGLEAVEAEMRAHLGRNAPAPGWPRCAGATS